MGTQLFMPTAVDAAEFEETVEELSSITDEVKHRTVRVDYTHTHTHTHTHTVAYLLTHSLTHSRNYIFTHTHTHTHTLTMLLALDLHHSPRFIPFTGCVPTLDVYR